MKRLILVVAASIVALGAMSAVSLATWKPEYGKSPPAVQEWFRNAAPPIRAQGRLGISKCCEYAERLRTKFIGAGTDWAYYPDPACTGSGCPILPLPADIIHDEPIHADNPADDNLPEFQQMRREGVLFIWRGKPTCFWPPEPSI